MFQRISPNNTTFVLLSFEGPDKYSLVGGLGTRVSELSNIIDFNGFENHIFFIGAPYMPEVSKIKNTWRRRFCRRISMKYPDNVYSGELEKLDEWNKTAPESVIEQVVIPSARKGIMTVILAEDWHTSESVIRLDQLLREKNLREYCVIFWNINNEYGLSAVNLKKLASICTVTTVSEFMKKRIRQIYSIDAAAIPNGIPSRIIGEPDQKLKDIIRSCFQGMILQKVARYDSDKNWICAIETIALLKQKGFAPHFLMRGGAQSYRTEVICKILDLNLKYVTVSLKNPTFESIIESFIRYKNFDIIELDFFIPEDFLMLLYGAADMVFANSTYEPFGIVGLEVMAKKGIAIVGKTGEDYAVNLKNSLRTDSESPEELEKIISKIMKDKQLNSDIREAGIQTAKSFTWDKAFSILRQNIDAIINAYNYPKTGSDSAEDFLFKKAAI